MLEICTPGPRRGRIRRFSPKSHRHWCLCVIASFEVIERLDALGNAVIPLDLRGVERVAHEISATGVTAVAVCLLHAYRNPVHERAVRDALKQHLPGVAVSLSSDLSSGVP